MIRGNVPIGGWKLTAVDGDQSKTRLTYIAELDLKGNIPGFVIKQANKDQGYQIVKMRTVIEKFIKEQNIK